MELIETRVKVGCDMPACGNFAEYTLKSKALELSGDMHFCRDCLLKLYAEIGRLAVPKSPLNPFGKYLRRETVGAEPGKHEALLAAKTDAVKKKAGRGKSGGKAKPSAKAKINIKKQRSGNREKSGKQR